MLLVICLLTMAADTGGFNDSSGHPCLIRLMGRFIIFVFYHLICLSSLPCLCWEGVFSYIALFWLQRIWLLRTTAKALSLKTNKTSPVCHHKQAWSHWAQDDIVLPVEVDDALWSHRHLCFRMLFSISGVVLIKKVVYCYPATWSLPRNLPPHKKKKEKKKVFLCCWFISDICFDKNWLTDLLFFKSTAWLK